MPGWTLETLPTGFTYKTVVDASQGPTAWHVVTGYGQVSGRLDPGAEDYQAALDAFVDSNLPPAFPAANQASILHERNRWLAQTDPFVLPTASLPADMPADVLAAISDSGSQQEILAWRQQLRDYPSTVTDWARPPALPTPPSIPLPSGRQLIIVT